MSNEFKEYNFSVNVTILAEDENEAEHITSTIIEDIFTKEEVIQIYGEALIRDSNTVESAN